jgi:hypothetical protein
MKNLRLFGASIALTIAGIGFQPAAHGHGSMGSNEAGKLASLMETANLVITGEVARVEYRNSKPSQKGEPSLPHAFVTYRIEDVFRGKTREENLTMRFVGGPDGRGGFMDVSGVPLFQEGERDLLFVTGNGEKGCPLVACEWGRYRVYEHGVYNTKGSPVRAVVDGMAIARGVAPEKLRTFSFQAPTFDGLLQNREVRELLKKREESMDELREIYETSAPKRIEVYTEVTDLNSWGDAHRKQSKKRSTTMNQDVGAASMEEPEIPEGPMAEEEFLGIVKELSKQTRRKPEPVRSIDPDAPIYVEMARQMKPHEPPRRKQDISASKQELEVLRESNFNPVLGKKPEKR